MRETTLSGLLAVVLAASQTHAVMIDTVAVGHTGNVGELSGAGAGGTGPGRVCGAVDYAFHIGVCEVTNAQYVEFLNAVDPQAVNTHGLYNTWMTNDAAGGIMRTLGNPVGLRYAVKPGRGSKPVNYVSFWDACRFANWLNNGQANADTETGAYTLTTAAITNNTVTRNAGAQWAVTSEDEWYKAAYYDPDAGVYYNYATASDAAPAQQGPPGKDAPNGSANYNHATGDLTDVGAYTAKPSDSPYGTFDQCGNVWEWNESILGSARGLRGGAYYSPLVQVDALGRIDDTLPEFEIAGIGFRVVQIPEPASVALLLGAVAAAWKRPRRR